MIYLTHMSKIVSLQHVANIINAVIFSIHEIFKLRCVFNTAQLNSHGHILSAPLHRWLVAALLHRANLQDNHKPIRRVQHKGSEWRRGFVFQRCQCRINKRVSGPGKVGQGGRGQVLQDTSGHELGKSKEFLALLL